MDVLIGCFQHYLARIRYDSQSTTSPRRIYISEKLLEISKCLGNCIENPESSPRNLLNGPRNRRKVSVNPGNVVHTRTALFYNHITAIIFDDMGTLTKLENELRISDFHSGRRMANRSTSMDLLLG